jgi:hypothetical protein
MRVHREARDERIYVGIGRDLGCVDIQLATPHQPCLLTLLHNTLEEALENVDAVAVANAGKAGVVWQCFVQVAG